MSIVRNLSDLAQEIGEELQSRRSVLDAELLRVEAHAREIRAELGSMDLARERLSSFQVQIGEQYQCPNCWVRDEAQSVLVPIPPDAKDDYFRCETCGCEALIDWSDSDGSAI
jgi:hypothetical protein